MFIAIPGISFTNGLSKSSTKPWSTKGRKLLYYCSLRGGKTRSTTITSHEDKQKGMDCPMKGSWWFWVCWWSVVSAFFVYALGRQCDSFCWVPPRHSRVLQHLEMRLFQLKNNSRLFEISLDLQKRVLLDPPWRKLRWFGWLKAILRSC